MCNISPKEVPETIGKNLHPVILELQHIFDATTLDTDALVLFVNSVDAYFKENAHFKGESYLEALNDLYALNDFNLYHLIQIEAGDHYDHYLMPSSQQFNVEIARDSKRYLKASSPYTKEALAIELRKVKRLVKEIRSEIKNLSCMTRRATGIGEPEKIQYPPFEELKHFYECGRKVAYNSEQEVLVRLFVENEAYLCQHCGQFHQGRSSGTGVIVNDSAKLTRYERAWRQYHRLQEFRGKKQMDNNND